MFLYKPNQEIARTRPHLDAKLLLFICVPPDSCGISPLIFTPIEWVTISLEQVSNETSFMNLFKILNDCSTIWAALYSSPREYFHFARFMFCHQSLHKPIVIIQIKPDIQYSDILYPCWISHIWNKDQVCDAGNTSCWIFNWCWTCAQQLSLGIFFAQILLMAVREVW